MKHDFGTLDLLILLKRDISLQHIIEEDPQGPYSGWDGMILMMVEPLGWAVHSSTWRQNRGGACKSEEIIDQLYK